MYQKTKLLKLEHAELLDIEESYAQSVGGTCRIMKRELPSYAPLFSNLWEAYYNKYNGALHYCELEYKNKSKTKTTGRILHLQDQVERLQLLNANAHLPERELAQALFKKQYPGFDYVRMPSLSMEAAFEYGVYAINFRWSLSIALLDKYKAVGLPPILKELEASTLSLLEQSLVLFHLLAAIRLNAFSGSVKDQVPEIYHNYLLYLGRGLDSHYIGYSPLGNFQDNSKNVFKSFVPIKYWRFLTPTNMDTLQTLAKDPGACALVPSLEQYANPRHKLATLGEILS